MDNSFNQSDKISSTINEHIKHVQIALLNDKYHVKTAVNDVPFGWRYNSNFEYVIRKGG